MKVCRTIRSIVAVSVLVAMAGCVSRPSSFVASSKPIAQGGYTTPMGNKPITGTCWQTQFLFLSFGRVGSSQSIALQNALDRVEGSGVDALISMSVDTEAFEILPFLCPVIGFYATRVTGIPVATHDTGVPVNVISIPEIKTRNQDQR